MLTNSDLVVFRYVTTGEMPGNKVFAHPLPLNVIPHIDVFQPNGYTKEEMKVTWESRKIMDIPDLKVGGRHLIGFLLPRFTHD